MNRHKFLVIGGVVAGALIFQVALVSLDSTKSTIKQDSPAVSVPQTVERKASFAIFTNGTLRIFSDPKYHRQSNDVYIENSQAPNVIIVKKEGITWGDFFKTLPMSLSSECLTTGTGQSFCNGEAGTLSFYINGERVSNALDIEISNEDRLLVSFGSQNEAEIKSQLSQIPALPASD